MKKWLERLNNPEVLMVLAFIFGMTLVSMSEIANPGYGRVPGMGMVILGTMLFTSVFAWVYAKQDAIIIKEHKVRIIHFIRFVIRFFTLLIFSFASLRCICWDIAWLTIFQGALFWILFDIFLNVRRDKDWNYVSVWPGTSWLDKIFKRHWIPWMVIKVVILIWFMILLG